VLLYKRPIENIALGYTIYLNSVKPLVCPPR